MSERCNERFLRGVDAFGALKFAAAEGPFGGSLGRSRTSRLGALSFGHRGVFWCFVLWSAKVAPRKGLTAWR